MIADALDAARRKGIEEAAEWHRARAASYRSSQHDPDRRLRFGIEEYAYEQIRALADKEPQT